MKFDMNRAWAEALALFKANRDVIAGVAGVFFLLPGFAAAILFADLIDQAGQDFAAISEIVRNSGDAADIVNGFTTAMRDVLLLSGAILLVSLFGISTLLGLFNDRERPTLGAALGLAAKGMPSLVAAMVLFLVGYLLGAIVLGLVADGFTLMLGTPAIGGVLTILFLGFTFYAATRLSMTLPVIVLERRLNPIAAFVGSWKLTTGKALSLFGFYALLTLAYLAITLVLGRMILPGLREVLGGGTVGITTVNLIGGLAEALVASLFACLVAAIHRQLSTTMVVR